MRSKLGYGGALAIGCAALFGIMVFACLGGSADIGFGDAAGAMLKKLPLIGGLFKSSETADIIVGSIRLPRVLSAALVGGALAVCGCALQGLFKILWRIRAFWEFLQALAWARRRQLFFP